MSINSIIKIIETLANDFKYAIKARLLIRSCHDRTSRQIIRSRINYNSRFLLIYQNRIPFCKSPLLRFQKRIIKYTKPVYHIDELAQYQDKTIVLMGHGDEYEYSINVLKNSSWKRRFRLIGNSVEGLETISKDTEILVTTNKDTLARALSEISSRNLDITVVAPEHGYVYALTGNQYFDCFSPGNSETVLDCGAFDGQTELDIIKWGGNNVKKIYAFELDPANAIKCKNFYTQYELTGTVELICKGTSNQNGIIHIDMNGEGTTGSCIGEGNIEAQVVRIDDEIKEPVTFIKMDIEGAELDSLKGAKDTIISNRPRLAICIYHTERDIIDIPEYLLSIVPDYHFTVRHYGSNQWETVLYAWVSRK